MKRLFRNLFCTVTVLGLGFGVTGHTFASTSQFKEKSGKQSFTINSVQQLKNEIRNFQNGSTQSKITPKLTGDVQSIERNYIFENTDPEVLDSYLDSINDEIFDAINQMSEETTVETDQDNDVHYTDSIEISDGGQVSVDVSDEAVEETTDQGSLISPMSTVTKGFGSRLYKVKTHLYHLLYPDTYFGLYTHYNIGKGGLTATSTSVTGTSAVFPSTVHGSSKITDKYAEKNGYDINGQGNYTYTLLGYNGVGLYTKYVTLRSSVKLVTKYSSSAKVSQTYKAYD